MYGLSDIVPNNTLHVFSHQAYFEELERRKVVYHIYATTFTLSSFLPFQVLSGNFPFV
jgi:hypothetical protein